MARRKNVEMERLRRSAKASHDAVAMADVRRMQAESVVEQQRRILDALTEQVANVTCGWAFDVGLRNPGAVVP